MIEHWKQGISANFALSSHAFQAGSDISSADVRTPGALHRLQSQRGVHALLDKDRRRLNVKNRTVENTEKAVLAYSLAEPAHGQTRASNELRKRGVFISPSGVRGVWLRANLPIWAARTPSTWAP
jgi:hypothetical protein